MNLPAFEVDATGVYRPGDLHIAWRDEPASMDRELLGLIEQTWTREMAAARHDGRNLFNGQLVRYLRHQVDGHTLSIQVGPTDYAAFMGTNYLHYDRAVELGWESFSNPIGTSTNVITADGKLVCGRRNQKVACHAGFVHNIGGGLEAGERRADGTFDAFASMRRELHEEAGVEEKQIRELVCLGMIRDPFVRQPELIFDARVSLSRREIEQRMNAMDDEHEQFVSCADDPEAILRFIQTTPKIAPISVGALCLHGRRIFGEAWYQRVLPQLPPPLPPR